MNLELPTTVPLQAYLALAAILFCTGVWGLINSRNAVRVLMSIELMLNAVNLAALAFGAFMPTLAGQGVAFALLIIAVAAAEATVGLAIVRVVPMVPVAEVALPRCAGPGAAVRFAITVGEVRFVVVALPAASTGATAPAASAESAVHR